MLSAKQRAGMKSAAKIFQRMSAASYTDLSYWQEAFWLDELSADLKADMMHYQAWHAHNSARARKILFRLIGEKP